MTYRGTSNANVRGSSRDRAKRREWLVRTFRSNSRGLVPTCRCYRCGKLLDKSTVTVDRIIPGCRGGSYRRNNIRPACAGCNSETGGSQRRNRKARKT